MRVIKECDRIDYMNGIPLHDYSSETIMVEGEHSLYMAFISRMSIDTLSLRPIQQTDAERYGSDSRVLYLHRNSMGGSHMVRSGTMASLYGGGPGSQSYSVGYPVGGQSYGAGYPVGEQAPLTHTPTWTTSWGSTNDVEQAVDRTPEQEREYGILRRIYNRIRI